MKHILLKLIFFCLIYFAKVHTIDVAISIEEDDLPVYNVIKLALTEAKIPSVKIDKIILLIANDNLNNNQILENLFKNNSKPVFLIDNTFKHNSNASFSSKLKILVREIGLPTFSVGKSLSRPSKSIEQWKFLNAYEQKHLIQFSQPSDIIPTIINDFYANFKIDLLHIFYDEQFDLKFIYGYVFKEFKGKYFIRKISIHNYEMYLEKLDKEKNCYIFVLASIEMINKVLVKINELNLLGIQKNWYFITKNLGSLQCEKCKFGSINLIQPLKTNFKIYQHNCSMRTFDKLTKIDAYFFYDLTRFILHTLKEIGDQMIKNGLELDLKFNFYFEKDFKRNINNKKRDFFDFVFHMSMDDFVGHYGRFVVYNNSNQIAYQEITMKLTKVELWKSKQDKQISHKTNSTSSNLAKTNDENFNLLKLGEWVREQSKGFFIWTPELKKKSKNHYLIVVIVQPPFIMKRINKNNLEWYGYCIDLLNEIQKEMNDSWTYELYEVPDGQYGIKDLVTNKWNGMIGQLEQKIANIAVGPVSVMSERENVVDFTVPYYNLVGISILMKKSASRSHLFKFLTVFENKVWLYIFISYIVTSFLIWFFDKLSFFSYSNNKEKYKGSLEKRDFNIKECFWFCMTSITPQGGGESPINLSSLFIVATWWIFGFIIISCYTANLAAFLTVSRLDSPIESLDHLVEQYRIKYSVQAGTQALTYFERMVYIEQKFYEIWKEITIKKNYFVDSRERARFSVWNYPLRDKYTKILKQMHLTGMPRTFEEGVKRVKKSKSAQEGFAFLADAIKIKYSAMMNCDLKQVGNEFSRKPLALAVPENSTLKEQLSSAILKLLNKRKLESLKEKWWNENLNRKEDCDYDKKLNDGISINNIGGIFVIIFIGIVLACLTLFMEWAWKKFKLNVLNFSMTKNKTGESNHLQGIQQFYYKSNLISTINLNEYNNTFYDLHKRKNFK